MKSCPRKRLEVFMAKEAWMDNTHVRVTSADGRTSYLYGTIDDYVPARALDNLFWGARSTHK